MPRIRPYRAEDAEACRALLAAVLPEYGLKVDFEKTDSDLHDVEGVYLRKGGAFWVIESDDGASLLGMGGVERTAPDTGEVRKMYFRKELRGQGFGRRMLDLIVEFARANGVRRLTLETATVLAEAVRLYERYGFVRDPSLLHTCRCDVAYRYDIPG